MVKKSSQSVKINRSTVDQVVSWAGLCIAIGLVFASIALAWTHTFIHGQVSEQLSSQKIFFPEKDSAAFVALDSADQKAVEPFAGQQLTTGAGAEVFANHYIAAHIQAIGEGQTYSELSTTARENPDDTSLAAKVDTVFKGETLRGTLLNAYAFDTMSFVAHLAGLGAGILAALLFFLSFLGFRHAKKVK